MKKSSPARAAAVTGRSLRRRNALIVFLFCAVTALLVILFLSGCRIQTVVVENASAVSEQSVLEAAGIKAGRHQYAIDKSEIAADIKAISPYIKSVTVKRRLPAELHIVVEEYEPLYYTEYNGAYWILSDSLLVLEVFPEEASAAQKAVTHLILPEIKACEVGKTLTFTDESDAAAARECLTTFQSFSFEEPLSLLDVSEKFNITADIANKYKLIYGNSERLAEKIEFSLRAVQYLSENMYGASGTIYAAKPGEASFEITGVTKEE